MSAEWPLVSLDQLVEFKTGKLDSNAAIDNGEYPFFTCSPTTLSIDKYAFDTEAVLLAGNNANGIFPIKYYQGKFNAYQRTYVITPKGSQKLSTKWLYFRIKHVTAELQQMSVGSATKFLTKKILDAYQILLPPLNVQEYQSDVLWSIQNKIDLNAEINQTLEQMAQALFKSWFVDFEPVKAKIAALEAGGSEEDALLAAMQAISGTSLFDADTSTASAAEQLGRLQAEQPEQYAELRATAELFPAVMQDSELGEIPERWEVSCIGDQVSAVGGGTPSTKNPVFWDGGDINWTTPKDMSNLADNVLIGTERRITSAGLGKISSGLLPVDTVLMSSRAPVGYLALAKIPVAVNQGYIAMRCDQTLSPEFVIQWCSANMDEIKNRASGTTFAEISKKNFRMIAVVVPSATLTSAFSKQVRQLYLKIEMNAREAKTLAELRDILLPKLLSGELSVTSAETRMSEAGEAAHV
jgi:type I restriction enzyme S subunit